MRSYPRVQTLTAVGGARPCAAPIIYRAYAVVQNKVFCADGSVEEALFSLQIVALGDNLE